MSTFARVDGRLVCEGVPLSTIARAVGTPTYIYSTNAVREQYARLSAALDGVPFRIHYSLKANSNLALLRLLRSLGAAADVVSGGELFRARRAGFEPHDIIFGGVGKTEREIGDGIDAGVLLLNIESDDELRIVDRLGRERGVVVPVAIRVNPEITVETPHSYIRTGEKGHKFGVPYDEVRDVARAAALLPNVMLHGLDIHVGSQLSRLDAYRHGIERVLELLAQLRADGAQNLRYLDIGGGLAVTYDAEEPTDLERFAQIVVPAVRSTGLQLIVEPGRFMVGNAAVLISRVLYRKRSGGKELLVIDAGMTDLLRPSHYNAYHRMEAVESVEGRSRVDVVGPVCESGDFLGLDRELEDMRPGDLLAIHSAGAYGYVMSSNYNTRGRPAEVLVDGDRFALVTQRESYEHLVTPELLEPEWRVD
ncbi:MAG TPA: diaminopimelate decarboxylase [Gemmatimonadaceae bacterium]|jgi:diaminopimelate decarboxylase|nr:diaminopimelate decarboxylase [Gemmatimonadaceae bacterium]